MCELGSIPSPEKDKKKNKEHTNYAKLLDKRMEAKEKKPRIECHEKEGCVFLRASTIESEGNQNVRFFYE